MHYCSSVAVHRMCLLDDKVQGCGAVYRGIPSIEGRDEGRRGQQGRGPCMENTWPLGWDQYSNQSVVISGLSRSVLKEQPRNRNLYWLLISIDVSGSGNNCGEEEKERKKQKDRGGQQRRR